MHDQSRNYWRHYDAHPLYSGEPKDPVGHNEACQQPAKTAKTDQANPGHYRICALPAKWLGEDLPAALDQGFTHDLQDYFSDK